MPKLTHLPPRTAHSFRRGFAWLGMSLLVSLLASAATRAAELFPFVLPWDDASPSATNVSAWLEVPAGKGGFVTVKDGHLFANGKRLRIFGVNLAFGANFPTHDDAEKVAARMAKFGINCVRFHHMDWQTAPSGIWAKDYSGFDPGQLDRLDYFIAQLKARGIYTDLNLHVSRTYPDRPAAEKQGNPNFDAGVDNFSPKMIALQKDFARALLTHVNPYTKNAYTDEPAVALIEINNENALLAQWNWGGLDKAAAPYRAELGAMWTDWLRKKYGDDAKLAAAWATGAKAAGAEMLKNGDFARGKDGWYFEQHEGAVADVTVKDRVLRVDVRKAGALGWHVQGYQSGLKLSGDEPLMFSFRARADAKRTINVAVMQAHEPWKGLTNENIDVGPEWRDFRVFFTPDASEPNARIGFSNLALAAGWFEFSAVSLRPAGTDGSVPRDASGGVAPFTKSEIAGRSEQVRDDWQRFLWTLEQRYWPGMYRFIREDLKAKSLIIGTQLGWSPFLIQQHMDVIDSHAYWQHPQFPRRPWDMNDWTVKNTAMTGAPDGGTLPALALQRVAGKPYVCTEYNHAAPNQFSAETFPLICAYAALQDWDGIFAFAYSHRSDDWAKGYFPSFFDIDQHPAKMATLPASLALFMRGDVAPAKTAMIANVQHDMAVAMAREQGQRLGAEQFGVKRMAALQHRVGVQQGDAQNFSATPAPAGPKFASDTGELTWDTLDKAVTIDTARSKGVLGFVERRSYDLGGVKLDFAATRAGFACVQLTVLDGADFKTARRILVTATATAENTGMEWTNDKKESVGTKWGRAPSLAEGVAAKITLPLSKKLKAWALDDRGQRRAELPLTDGVLEISPDHKTLWYELSAD